MTTIRLLTSDQHLIVFQKVKLASGDINSVRLSVTFDDLWEEFWARTAIFYTSKDSTKYEVLMVDNECTVPHEVLSNEGTLFIGIRAATTDGTKIKTSSIVKLKIVKGENAADTTISPTMDLYQQYLAAMRDQLDPAMTEVKATLAEHVKDNKQSFEKHRKYLDDNFSKMSVYSYPGDGGVGINNPTRIPLPFAAKAVFITGKTGGLGIWLSGAEKITLFEGGIDASGWTNIVNYSEDELSWYYADYVSSQSPCRQFNQENETYFAFILG